MPSRISSSIAVLMLLSMAGFMLYTAWTDSATFDESAHIGAGYSYVTLRDLRLNPEHPPLIKAFAGLTARFADNFRFPSDTDEWRTGVNEQWRVGGKFLYEYGNDADILIFGSRLGPILLTLLLGWFLFRWGTMLLGPALGLLFLFFFAFSPNFVAHGHYVTTDIGATFGAALALFYFLSFLKHPSQRNMLIAGTALGIALLLKFSLLLLVPVLIVGTFAWALLEERQKVRGIVRWFLRLAAIGLIAVLVAWIAYQGLLLNYPHEKQISDAHALLASYNPKIPKAISLWLVETPFFRGLGQYTVGALMNLQRASWGNNAYFLGELSNKGWWYYFPVVYLIKEPLPILIVMAIALIGSFSHLFWYLRLRLSRQPAHSYLEWLRANFDYAVMLLFIAVYWISSMSSPLNIGVRHIFPTLPFLWLLTLRHLKNWVFPALTQPMEFFTFLKFFIISPLKVAFISLLAAWYLIEFLYVAPHFLTYFNEIAGGPRSGHNYVVDSNFDWGQDLKRLARYVKAQGIEKIKVDYFGGGSPRYYLKDRYEPMRADDGPQKGWIAVSASFYQGERARPAAGWDQACCRYHWLDLHAPVTRIGYSIFVFKINEPAL